MVTFWAISYNVTIMIKVCGYFLGNFWGKLGNFLFHHLVTLIRCPIIQTFCCDSVVSRVAR